MRSLSQIQTAPMRQKTVCSDALFHREKRFNLESFAVFYTFDPFERCRRIKRKQRRLKKKSSQDIWAFGAFLQHHGEKSASGASRGRKSNYMTVQFKHFFMRLPFEIWKVCRAAALFKFSNKNCNFLVINVNNAEWCVSVKPSDASELLLVILFGHIWYQDHISFRIQISFYRIRQCYRCV